MHPISTIRSNLSKKKALIFNLFSLERFDRIIRLSTLLICSFVIVSCQAMIRKTPCVDSSGTAMQAAELISTLISKYDTDISVKGIGRVALWDSGGIQTSRAAWAGAPDGRMRVELLGLAGHPVAKFIYDGEGYVFVSPLEQRTYRKSGVDADLDTLTGIPIPSADIIKLLSGMIPVQSFDEAMFLDGAPHCRDALILRKKWHGVVEKLFLNDVHDRVVKVEMYRWGRIVYRVEIGEMQIVEGREIPFRLVFSTDDHQGFSIDVEKSWLNIEIPDEMFVIQAE